MLLGHGPASQPLPQHPQLESRMCVKHDVVKANPPSSGSQQTSLSGFLRLFLSSRVFLVLGDIYFVRFVYLSILDSDSQTSSETVKTTKHSSSSLQFCIFSWVFGVGSSGGGALFGVEEGVLFGVTVGFYLVIALL